VHIVSPNRRWQRIEDLFNAALDLEPSALDAIPDEACGKDGRLRDELNSLLKSSEQTLDFVRETVLQQANDERAIAIPAGNALVHTS
jgi:hypothetical protein